MKQCPKCRVTIENNLLSCPLCGGSLKETNARFERDYPNILARSTRRRFAMKVLLFILVIAGAVSVLVNTMNPSQALWSICVVASIIYLWVSVVCILRSSRNIGLMILIQILLLSGLCIVINYFAGPPRWSVDYVVPILIIVGTAVITVITLVRPMQLRDYLVYLVDLAVLGVISLLLIWLNIATVRWALVASAFYTIATLAGMFLFSDRRTRHEMKKRFHL